MSAARQGAPGKHSHELALWEERGGEQHPGVHAGGGPLRDQLDPDGAPAHVHKVALVRARAPACAPRRRPSAQGAAPPPGALPCALPRGNPLAPCPGVRTDLGTHTDTRHAAPGWHAAWLHKA